LFNSRLPEWASCVHGAARCLRRPGSHGAGSSASAWGELEWKAHGHDQPADLADRLCAHGFVREDVETVMIGETALMAREPVLRAGVVLREVTQLDDS
jgi:hypothetical protein